MSLVLLKRAIAYIVDLSIISYVFALFANLIVFVFYSFIFKGLTFPAVDSFFMEDYKTSLLPYLFVFSQVLTMASGLVWIFLVILICFSLTHDSYFLYMEYKKGTTIGKRLFGLSVVSSDQKNLKFSQILVRNLFRYVDAIFILPVIIFMFFNKNHCRLGDLIGKTSVIYSVEKEGESRYHYISQNDYNEAQKWFGPITLPDRNSQMAFLEFAYSQFILQGYKASIEVRNTWSRLASTYLTKEYKPYSDDNLNSEALLRIFAEYCWQNLYQEGHKVT